MRSFVYLLLDPLTQLWLLAALGGLLYYRDRRKWGYGCWIAAVVWFALFSTSPLPQALVYAKERQHPVLQPVPTDSLPTDIIVLGGGSAYAPDLPATEQLSPQSRARLVEGIRLYRQLPRARLVCSGFSSTDAIPIATMQAHAAVVLGVPPADTLMLNTPHNTEAEARAYVARFGSERRLILVTSAIHIPRALFWFRHYGLDPLPAPADHRVKIDPRYSPYTFRPSSRKIEMMDRWLHEFVGLWWAKLKTITHD